MTLDLSRFLELDHSQAESEWRRIKRRVRRKKQEDFLPVEVLLCYGLFRILNPHRYGGANIDQVPSVVNALAHAFVRSPGSIISKMLNLDGSRSHGAKLEVLLFCTLAEEPDRYADLYRVVMLAGWSVGFGADELPDVLGWLSGGSMGLLGQDEIQTPELDLAWEETEAQQRELQDAYKMPRDATSRLVEQRVRLGQHRFASATLKNYGFACGFCGMAPGALDGKRLLVASHIKPWCKSSNRERLDPRNGIAACPIHDVAFDGGLLTVNGGLRIHRAAPLQELLVRDAPADRFFGDRILGPKLHLPVGAEEPRKKYLQYHRKYVFSRPA